MVFMYIHHFLMGMCGLISGLPKPGQKGWMGTLGFFDHIIAGREDLIKELFHASVTLHPPFRQGGKTGSRSFTAELENHSDLSFILKKEGKGTRNDRTDIVKLSPQSIVIINYRESEEVLDYRLTNCYSDMNMHPVIELPAIK